MTRAILSLCTAAALAACAQGPSGPVANREFAPVSSAGEFIDVVANKPITFPNGSTMIAAPDGSLTGSAGGQPMSGTWSFDAGQFCREIVVDGVATPEVCNAMEVAEEGLRLLNPDGTLLVEAALGS